MNNIVTMENQTLGMQKLVNARQLGGYRTADGRTVRRDLLLRTGALADGTAEDLHRLTDHYHITTVIDLRTSAEIAKTPDPVLEGVRSVVVHVIDEERDLDASAAMLQVYVDAKDDPGKALLMLHRMGAPKGDTYTAFLGSPVAMAGYRWFFDLLLEQKDGAILWHCTGGKDRTGISSALLLSVLGVDRETVLADFALTNDFNRRRIDYMVNAASKHTDDPAELQGVATLVGVSRAKMEKLFELAEAECGSMEAFVRKHFRLTNEEVNKLRDKYLI